MAFGGVESGIYEVSARCRSARSSPQSSAPHGKPHELERCRRRAGLGNWQGSAAVELAARGDCVV